jgi:hypothetical protein
MRSRRLSRTLSLVVALAIAKQAGWLCSMAGQSKSFD